MSLNLWLKNISSILSSSNMMAYLWHASEDHFEWAGDIETFLGLEAGELPATNAHYNSFVNPQSIPQRLAALHDSLRLFEEGQGQGGFDIEYKMRASNGLMQDVNETVTLMRDAGGKIIVQGLLKVKATDNLLHDERNLASIPGANFTRNGRLALLHDLDEWIECNRSSNNATGYLLIIDMDRLGIINEAYGSKFADEIIEQTGSRLERIAGSSAFATRIGGDVFGVFFKNAPHNEMAAAAKHILKNFYDVPVMTTKGPVAVSVSIGGVTVIAKDKDDAASYISKGQVTVRFAKERGRSCFVSYKEAAQHKHESRTLLEEADVFLRALKSDRVKLAFQPVMDSRTNSVSFHECLMRMIDTDGKIHSAASFIPAVEKMGLSRLVDQYAMRMAIQELCLFPDLQLSVNVSGITLIDNDWLRGVVAMLRDRPSVAKRLVVEVTESCVIQDEQRALRVTRTIQELGVRVALDDFGAGYTAFSQIKQLDVDLVKIDKQFIRNINESDSYLFVKTLQSLADGVNIETVGEGVETMSDANKLIRDGIHHIQGYAFGMPSIERVWLPKDHIHRKILTHLPHERDLFDVRKA
jgi:diguanylate cyclase (GGDEF)-like protein